MIKAVLQSALTLPRTYPTNRISGGGYTEYITQPTRIHIQEGYIVTPGDNTMTQQVDIMDVKKHIQAEADVYMDAINENCQEVDKLKAEIKDKQKRIRELQQGVEEFTLRRIGVLMINAELDRVYEIPKE